MKPKKPTVPPHFQNTKRLCLMEIKKNCAQRPFARSTPEDNRPGSSKSKSWIWTKPTAKIPRQCPSAKFTDFAFPPLRSHAEPWGFMSTSVREVRQILMANLLMSFVLLCYAWQTVHGRFGLIEHPQMPDDPDLASIWRTKLWTVLAQANTITVDIAQGYFGAPSSKPTKLALTPRLHWAADTLRQHHVRNYLPQTSSIGKNESGEFKTAILKEYPPALSQGLARLLFDWTDVLEPNATDRPIPESLPDLCKDFVITGEHAMGMDYVARPCKLIQVA